MKPAVAFVALFLLVACAAFVSNTEQAAAQSDPAPLPQVVIETDVGRMVASLELDRAPLSVCNFLFYVTDGHYDGGRFYRTVVSATDTNRSPIDVIQAASRHGIESDNDNPPISLERTSETGLTHRAGTISMARDEADTATSSFFIVTQDSLNLDFGGARNPDGQGFAAFGYLTEGLDIARQIQASAADDQEQLAPPVTIISAQLIGQMPPQCQP